VKKKKVTNEKRRDRGESHRTEPHRKTISGLKVAINKRGAVSDRQQKKTKRCGGQDKTMSAQTKRGNA